MVGAVEVPTGSEVGTLDGVQSGAGAEMETATGLDEAAQTIEAVSVGGVNFEIAPVDGTETTVGVGMETDRKSVV